jgi:LysR family transcriptional activator of nhaA
MERLNYNHLHYFWLVAREGSLARASEELGLAQSTISGQIHALEDAMGERIFTRSGRRLVLTDVGRVVFRFADEIFTLGRELGDALAGRPLGRPLKLVVGVAKVVPKLVARHLIEPAFTLGEPVHVVCHEDKPDRLVAELATHAFDIVLSDAPAPPALRVRVFNHLLGECGVVFFAVPELAAACRRKFPQSLNDAPFLVPTENTVLRGSLDQWFSSRGIRPRVVGEFEDSALLKVFGQSGKGIFAAPSVIAREVQRQYQVRPVGRADEIRERFYAISVERRLKHPAVVAIIEAARRTFVAP